MQTTVMIQAPQHELTAEAAASIWHPSEPYFQDSNVLRNLRAGDKRPFVRFEEFTKLQHDGKCALLATIKQELEHAHSTATYDHNLVEYTYVS